MNFKKIFALSVAAVLALSMTACGNSDDDDDEESTPSYEKPVEAFVKNIKNFNANNVKNNVFISKEIAYQVDMQFDGDEDEMDEFLEAMFSSLDEEFIDSFGEGYKLSYDVVEKEKLSDDELEDVNEYYGEILDKDDYEVDGGYAMDVEIIVKNGDETATAVWFFAVIEVDGDWSMYDWDEDWDFESKSDKNGASDDNDGLDFDAGDLEDMDYSDIMEAVPMA